MAEICDFALAQSFGYDCTNPVKQGAKNTAYIYNYDDIKRADINVVDGKITALPVIEGKTGYKVFVAGNAPYTGSNKNLVVGTYRNDYTKNVQFVILSNGADITSKVVQKLANGLFVMVIEKKYLGSTGFDNAFEVFGLESGLKCTAQAEELYSDDTEGGWSVTLTEEDAPSAGIFIVGESYDATKQALESSVV